LREDDALAVDEPGGNLGSADVNADCQHEALSLEVSCGLKNFFLARHLFGARTNN
jgi:hypothetical protein